MNETIETVERKRGRIRKKARRNNRIINGSKEGRKDGIFKYYESGLERERERKRERKKERTRERERGGGGGERSKGLKGMRRDTERRES